MSDVLMAASAEALPRASIKSWCETWLQAKPIETGEATRDRYKPIIEYFKALPAVSESSDFDHCHRGVIRDYDGVGNVI